MYSNDRLLILDADGTTIDAFKALETTFRQQGMEIGDLERFQKRRNLFKYLGGLKEFPRNLRSQITTRKREHLVTTLTEVYRHEARLYDGITDLINQLMQVPDLRVGVVTRNITHEPLTTLRQLFERNGVNPEGFDFLTHLPLKEDKVYVFRKTRGHFHINPARAFVCGDEESDFLAAVQAGLHPFMVSYGFEDYDRLTQKAGVPPEIISRNPAELAHRLRHALQI